MEFFASAVDTLKVLVMAIGCGLGAWGIVNLLEGYGADNPASKAQRSYYCKALQKFFAYAELRLCEMARAVQMYR